MTDDAKLPKSPDEELELLVPTEFPDNEFPDPPQDDKDLGEDDEEAKA